MLTDELEPDRLAVGQAARYGDTGMTGQVELTGVGDVAPAFLEVAASPDGVYLWNRIWLVRLGCVVCWMVLQMGRRSVRRSQNVSYSTAFFPWTDLRRDLRKSNMDWCFVDARGNGWRFCDVNCYRSSLSHIITDSFGVKIW